MTTTRKRTNQDHNTPVWVVDYVQDFNTIYLDPCSNPWSKIPASLNWELPYHDGLTLPWYPRCLAYVNPPYNNLGPWVAKCNHEASRFCEIILLVPADPSTRWGQLALRSADAVCWPKKRIAFEGAGGSGAKQPSALYYWGEMVKRFCRVFGRMGTVQQLAKYDGGACA